LRVTIDQMDNGVTMLVRRDSTSTTQGVVILRRVYQDIDALIADLREHLSFPSNGKK